MKKVLAVLLLVVMCIFIVLGGMYFFSSNSNYSDNREFLLFINGECIDKENYKSVDNRMFIAMELIKEKEFFDIYWDKDYNRISIFKDFIFHKITYNSSKANYNNKSYERDEIFLILEDKLYLNVGFLMEGLLDDVDYNVNDKVVLIGNRLEEYNVVKEYSVNNRANTLNVELKIGENVLGFDVNDSKYMLIYTNNHDFAFVKKECLTISKISSERSVQKEKRKDSIVLAWDLITAKINNFKPFDIHSVITVLSPTWYDLDEVEGYFRDISVREYTDYVQGKGVEMWPTFTNDFNLNRTNLMLNNAYKRSEIVDRIIEITEKEKYDGINIDFENVYMKDRDVYSAFIMELYCKARIKGIPVSVDVAILSNSETWSKFLDRKAIGKYSDYVFLMAYDENVSGKAGSVASIPWVEYGVSNILESVDAGKVAMAVPFYARLWEETKENGEAKVKATALKLETAYKVIDDLGIELKFDEMTGQNYGEIDEDGVLCRIWNEDEVSLRSRMDIVKKYNLVGKAVWAFDFGIDSMWDLLK